MDNIHSYLNIGTNKSDALIMYKKCSIGEIVETDSNLIESVFLFASVNRSDAKAKPVMIRVVAYSELEARRFLVQQYVLSLAARLPCKEIKNA